MGMVIYYSTPVNAGGYGMAPDKRDVRVAQRIAQARDRAMRDARNAARDNGKSECDTAYEYRMEDRQS